jgi:hypothetical protein
MKYNHAFTLGFSVVSATEDGSDVTAEQVRGAIRKLLTEYPDMDILENIGAPFDTYEMDEEQVI